jgi:hypothetical protein
MFSWSSGSSWATLRVDHATHQTVIYDYLMNAAYYVDQVSCLITGGICCRVGGVLTADDRISFQFVYRGAASIYWNDELYRFEDRYNRAGEDLEESCRRLLASVKGELGCELWLGDEVDWTDLATDTREAVAEVFRKL